MTWVFGSYLVTPFALTSCHVVISKQGDDSTSGQSGPTGVYPEGDHVTRTMWDRFRQSPPNRVSSQGHAADQRHLGPL